jgi:hypothetical protein
MTNEEKSEYIKNWRKDNPEKNKQHKTKWQKNNPEKILAHNTVNRAITNGILIREPCEICGDKKTEAHHDDYSKPLDVRWLCSKHHKAWHKNNRNKEI